MSAPEFKTLAVNNADHIATVAMNRADKSNALNPDMWREFREAFAWIAEQDDVRVVVVSGEGKNFTGGIDLSMMFGLTMEMGKIKCEGRKREFLNRFIQDLQDSFTCMAECRVPVIAAVQGACIGAGIDLITACDMRFCTEDAVFNVKEVDIGIAADVGTLQRLPKIVGDGLAREMAYTARNFTAEEAKDMHLVNRVYADQEALMAAVMAMAKDIAAKSPLAIVGTKEMLNYSRDHSVEDGLKYVATWNSAMLICDDTVEAMQAKMKKRTPEYDDLAS